MPSDESPGTVPQPLPSSRSKTSRKGLDELKSRVADDFENARDVLKDEAAGAVGKVKEVASEKTNLIARQVSGIGIALEKVAAELESSDQPQVGQYAKQIGETVKNLAKQMEGKNLGGVASMVQEIGRKQPVAFLGVAALAGFAASRFLTASANRAVTPSPHKRSAPGDKAKTEGASNG